jgi:hypothetical protein
MESPWSADQGFLLSKIDCGCAVTYTELYGDGPMSDRTFDEVQQDLDNTRWNLKGTKEGSGAHS